MQWQRHESSVSRHVSPELCFIYHPPRKSEGAGKAGWPLHPGLPRKSRLAQARKPQVQAVTTGLPCAVVLRLIRDLPGEPCRLPPSPRCACASSALRQPLGRQDHTISPYASLPLVNRHIRVHRLPASRVVTSAIRPSEDRGGMTRENTDFQNRASRIFLRADLERASTFDSDEEISISAHLNLAGEAGASSCGKRKADGLCPDERINPSVGLRRGVTDPLPGAPKPMSALPLRRDHCCAGAE